MGNRKNNNYQSKKNGADFLKKAKVTKESRGNTKEAIAEVMSDSYEAIRNVAQSLFRQEGITGRILKPVSDGRYFVSIVRPNIDGENHEVSIRMNIKSGLQDIDVDPKGENKENHYYKAKLIPQDSILEELKHVNDFLNTGKLNPQSSLKKIDIGNMYNFTTKIALDPFNQSLYNHLLLNEGQEVAVKYGKGLLSELEVEVDSLIQKIYNNK